MVTKIIYWWDRYTHNWIVQAKDAEKNQVGEAMYAANRHTLPGALETMARRHPSASVLHSKSADD